MQRWGSVRRPLYVFFDLDSPHSTANRVGPGAQVQHCHGSAGVARHHDRPRHVEHLAPGEGSEIRACRSLQAGPQRSPGHAPYAAASGSGPLQGQACVSDVAVGGARPEAHTASFSSLAARNVTFLLAAIWFRSSLPEISGRV